MNRQEVFDRVSNHLLTQMQVSVDDRGRCRYRHNGLKCAIGCLIEDDEYREDFESSLIFSGTLGLGSEKYTPQFVRTATTDDIIFLGDLQNIHDMNSPPEWKEQLAVAAKVYDLSGKVLENY